MAKKGNNLNEKVDSFTVGKDREYDMVLAEFDCEASIAHVKMLGRVGIINNHEVKKLCLVLDEIKKEIKNKILKLKRNLKMYIQKSNIF